MILRIVFPFSIFVGLCSAQTIDQRLDSVNLDSKAPEHAESAKFGIRPFQFVSEQEGASLGFRFYQPDSFSPEEKLPLVIWLHGQGGGGNDGRNVNIKLVRLLIGPEADEDTKCFLLFPQFQKGDNWWHYYDEKRGDQTGVAGAMVLRLIDEMCEKVPHVDSERIYILGASQGSLAQNIWFEAYRNRFAGSVQFAGSNPVDRLEKDWMIPTWVFYSSDDRVAMQSNITLRFINRMKEWDESKIRVTQYSDAGHGGTVQKGLSEPDWIEWLFSQRNVKDPVIDEKKWAWIFYGNG